MTPPMVPPRQLAAPPAHDNRLPAGLKARLVAGLAVKRSYHRHVQAEDGRMVTEALECRGCGETLRTWMPHPSLQPRQRRIGGTHTIIQEVRHAYVATAAYDEMILELAHPDGRLGQCITAVCKGCKARFTDADAADLYVSDLEQMAMDDAAAGVPVERTREALDFLEQWTATRIVRDV